MLRWLRRAAIGCAMALAPALAAAQSTVAAHQVVYQGQRLDAALGTAATASTGTGGHFLPFLDQPNTFSAPQIFPEAGLELANASRNAEIWNNTGPAPGAGVDQTSLGYLNFTDSTSCNLGFAIGGHAG